jgi:hypothetical protein
MHICSKHIVRISFHGRNTKKKTKKKTKGKVKDVENVDAENTKNVDKTKEICEILAEKIDSKF